MTKQEQATLKNCMIKTCKVSPCPEQTIPYSRVGGLMEDRVARRNKKAVKCWSKKDLEGDGGQNKRVRRSKNSLPRKNKKAVKCVLAWGWWHTELCRAARRGVAGLLNMTNPKPGPLVANFYCLVPQALSNPINRLMPVLNTIIFHKLTQELANFHCLVSQALTLNPKPNLSPRSYLISPYSPSCCPV